MLKASPSGADKIQSFPDLRQMLLYAALGGIVLAASSWRLSLHRGSRMFLRLTKTS